MAEELKGTKVISGLVPTSRLDQYPTHYAEFGKGGYRSVATIADRDNIPEQRRELGIQFENLMKSIENEIDLITDDQSANDFLKRINEFNHTMNSLDLTKIKLHSKSTSLGLSFDAQKKLYVKPSKKETANV